MTKKVKDLTFEDVMRICDNSHCDRCPFSYMQDDICFVLNNTPDEVLEKEVEVQMNDLIISIEDLLDEAKCNKENLVDDLFDMMGLIEEFEEDIYNDVIHFEDKKSKSILKMHITGLKNNIQNMFRKISK